MPFALRREFVEDKFVIWVFYFVTLNDDELLMSILMEVILLSKLL